MRDFYRTKAFHPYLYALIPVIDLFMDNRSKVSYFDLAFTLLQVTSLLLLLSLLVRLLIKEKTARGVFLLFFAFLTFSFRTLYEQIGNRGALNYILDSEIGLLMILVALTVSSAFLLRKKQAGFPRATAFFNIYTLILLLIALYNIGLFEIDRNQFLAGARTNRDLGRLLNNGNNNSIRLAAKNRNQPDIYYIILDTYARGDTLSEIYNFNNRTFLNALEERGFQVSSSSRTNYTFTQLSLASSLNMEYINYLTGFLGRKSRNPSIPHLMIMDNEVMDYTKSRGYKNVIFSTGWGPTKRSLDADAGYDYLPYFADEFNRVLIESTAFAPLARPLLRNASRNRILYNFDKVAETANDEEATFAFAHFILPHQPYLFDAEGNPRSLGRFEMGGDVWEYKDAYLEQLIFTNKKVLEMVDLILERSKTPPVIIIQSDHGPSSVGGWDDPSDRLLNERMNILSAFYLPGDEKDPLPDMITPVNYFRLIFNRYLDADFKILENRSYFSTKVRPYEFMDVTERLK